MIPSLLLCLLFTGAAAVPQESPDAERQRRARAILAAEEPDAELILGATGLLADPDPAIRALGIEFMARPDLGETARPERVRALAALLRARDLGGASKEPGQVLDALGRLGGAEAAAVLADVMATHARGEVRRAAAEALVEAPGGMGELIRLVRTLVPGRPSGSALEPEVIAILLPRYGRELGIAPTLRSLDLMPLAIGLKHPVSAVRAAAGEAFQELLDRLADAETPGASRAALEQLKGFGIGREVILYQSARLALMAEGDASAALRAAQELAQLSELHLDAELRLDPFDAQLWSFRAHYLGGLAQLALDQASGAEVALDRAAAALDAALAERRDLLSEPERLAHVDMLHQRALLEVARTLVPLVDAGRSGPAVNVVLDRARTAHELHLEAQAVYAEIRGDVLTGWDALLSADLSVYQLLFGRRGFGASGGDALGRARLVELQGELGRALSAVAPGELPGFEALAPVGPPAVTQRLTDPLADPVRRAFLERIRAARLAGIDDAIDEANSLVRRAQERAFGIIPEAEIRVLERLQRRRFAARQAAEEASRSTAQKWVRDLRIPGSAAIWHAQDLKEEGRGVEARTIATRLEKDLTERGISDWWFVLGHERVVRAQLLAGSAYTDEGRGEEAEKVLTRAVTRLEDIERDLRGRGATDGDLVGFRSLRSTALVSLAVNANVRLLDKEKALGYYERAYELRKDEFMKVLLACYRARSGDEAEARSLLRSIRPGPGTWYNLACTHALLGDTSRALDYLEAEIVRNHASEESANRQREWAAADPDLASLRGEARFQRLVRVD